MEGERKSGLAEGRKSGLAEGRKSGLEEGRKSGLAEGRKNGLAEGRKNGLAEGMEQKTIQIIRNMLQRGMAEEDICALAECGKEEVERVRKLN